MAKTYTVVKNDTEIETVKTLAAAKKLADSEGADVLCDGVKIYQANPDGLKQETAETDPAKPARKQSVLFRLKTLMNVRVRPCLTAPILTTKTAGSIVAVEKIEGDWLFLTDGTYILCEGGKYAEKM